MKRALVLTLTDKQADLLWYVIDRYLPGSGMPPASRSALLRVQEQLKKPPKK